jgi:hypothetical protein
MKNVVLVPVMGRAPVVNGRIGLDLFGRLAVSIKALGQVHAVGNRVRHRSRRIHGVLHLTAVT